MASGRIRENQLAVVISVYGEGYGALLEFAIAALARQQGLRYEIVISEQFVAEPLYSRATCDRVAYTAERVSEWIPGRARNRGALSARAPFILFQDVDIFPLQRTTLKTVWERLQPSSAGYIAGPKVCRIDAVAQDRFFELLLQHTDEDWRGILENTLTPAARELWQEPGSIRTTASRMYNGKEYVAFVDDVERFRQKADEYRGREVVVWKPIRHWGTIALSRELFECVGGYCETFTGWGCEDTDLHGKLGRVGDELNSGLIDWAFAHAEHDHEYIVADRSIANAALQRRRANRITTQLIEPDRLVLANHRASLESGDLREPRRHLCSNPHCPKC